MAALSVRGVCSHVVQQAERGREPVLRDEEVPAVREEGVRDVRDGKRCTEECLAGVGRWKGQAQVSTSSRKIAEDWCGAMRISP